MLTRQLWINLWQKHHILLQSIVKFKMSADLTKFACVLKSLYIVINCFIFNCQYCCSHILFLSVFAVAKRTKRDYSKPRTLLLTFFTRKKPWKDLKSISLLAGWRTVAEVLCVKWYMKLAACHVATLCYILTLLRNADSMS